MIETIQYGIKSVGHESPEPERRQVAPVELMQAFERFNAAANKYEQSHIIMHLYNHAMYSIAVNCVKDLRKVGVVEAHAFLQESQDHPRVKMAGIFVSAVYNILCDEQVIIFDVDNIQHLPNNLAFMLPKDKVFVNKTKVGHSCGISASGVLLNYGSASGNFGLWSDKIINYGTIQSMLGFKQISQQNKSIAVNLGIANWWLESGDWNVALNYSKPDVPLFHDTFGFRSWPALTRISVCDDPPGIVVGHEGDVVGLLRVFLRPEQCSQINGLEAYFQRIQTKLEEGRTDVEKAIQAAKTLDAHQIEQDLEQMITGAEYRW